jgi:hypothetical protein
MKFSNLIVSIKKSGDTAGRVFKHSLTCSRIIKPIPGCLVNLTVLQF